MRTETANLPGKCLHKHQRQFKPSIGKLAHVFFYRYVHMSTSVIILVVQATLKRQMFSGDIHSDQICHFVAVKCEQLLSTPVCVGILLIMLYLNEQWTQSVKPVNIYLLHYQAARPGPRTPAHTFAFTGVHTNTHRDTEQEAPGAAR